MDQIVAVKFGENLAGLGHACVTDSEVNPPSLQALWIAYVLSRAHLSGCASASGVPETVECDAAAQLMKTVVVGQAKPTAGHQQKNECSGTDGPQKQSGTST